MGFQLCQTLLTKILFPISKKVKQFLENHLLKGFLPLLSPDDFPVHYQLLHIATMQRTSSPIPRSHQQRAYSSEQFSTASHGSYDQDSVGLGSGGGGGVDTSFELMSASQLRDQLRVSCVLMFVNHLNRFICLFVCFTSGWTRFCFIPKFVCNCSQRTSRGRDARCEIVNTSSSLGYLMPMQLPNFPDSKVLLFWRNSLWVHLTSLQCAMYGSTKLGTLKTPLYLAVA